MDRRSDDSLGTNPEGYDVLPVLGQSNALGRGRPLDPALDGPHPRVFQLANLSSPRADEIIPGTEPLHHQEMPRQTVGFALSFAKIYANHHVARKVLLVPAARGNTGFTPTGDYTWRVGQSGPVNLYALAVAQIDKALAQHGANRVVGILWHQGEANNSTPPESYAADLDALILDIRARYGTTVPFVLGQMSPAMIAHEPATYGAIDAVHRATPWRLPHVGMWHGSSLLEPDRLHFSAAGQRANGVTAYEAFTRALTPRGGLTGGLTPNPARSVDAGSPVRSSRRADRSR